MIITEDLVMTCKKTEPELSALPSVGRQLCQPPQLVISLHTTLYVKNYPPPPLPPPLSSSLTLPSSSSSLPGVFIIRICITYPSILSLRKVNHSKSRLSHIIFIISPDIPTYISLEVMNFLSLLSWENRKDGKLKTLQRNYHMITIQLRFHCYPILTSTIFIRHTEFRTEGIPLISFTK